MYDRDHLANNFSLARAISNGVTLLVLICVLAVLVPRWLGLTEETAEDRARTAAEWARMHRENQEHRYLCQMANACRKYDTVRLECATAGNFRTCLRIKMGDDAPLLAACTVDWETGAPAIWPPNMPNRAACLL